MRGNRLPNNLLISRFDATRHGGVPALLKTSTDLCSLIASYRLCARAEGKSPKTIEMVTSCVGYLEDFLNSEGLTTDATNIGGTGIRAFILYLQLKQCFNRHPFAQPQPRGLSQHTVNTYLRSIRAFWSWLRAERIVEETPFARVRIPRAPRKIVATFSSVQIRTLLDIIDTTTSGRITVYRCHQLDSCLVDVGTW